LNFDAGADFSVCSDDSDVEVAEDDRYEIKRSNSDWPAADDADDADDDDDGIPRLQNE
jgi:hypothetical protein